MSLLAVGASVLGLLGQVPPPPAPPLDQKPAVLTQIGWEQRLGQAVPLDVALRDEAGRIVHLGDYFNGKPVILTFNYYECPMLCGMQLQGFVSALNVVSFDAGKEFEVLTVSIDPRETPAQAARYKKGYMDRYRRPTAPQGWHFLTADEKSIAAVAGAVGFRYAWDEETKQYAHPAGIVVLTPDARIGQYLFGIEYAPRDLRFALVEASQGRIGTVIDQAILYCYKYDPASGRYGAAIMRILRVASLLTLGAFGAFVFMMRRRDARLAARGSAS